jgi:cob(I)alamin adenosyltransferase
MSQAVEMGRVLIFTGDGKGKTTAALGMALRACGHGMRVFVLQFIKAAITGELAAARHFPGLEMEQTGRGFVPEKSSRHFQEHVKAAEKGVQRAAQVLTSGRYDLVVLDEICNAVALELLTEQSVIELLGKRPPAVTVVLTGRGATPRLLALADTVTEMRNVKHALAGGRRAQKGVEF